MNRKRKKLARKPQSASKTTPELITLTLDSVAFGGDALTRKDGKVYFVADALPGETVEAEIHQNKDRFAKARVVSRISAPSYAVPAPCSFAERCGGCQWQRVPAEVQSQWKKSFIEDALQRIGGIASGTYPFTMQASPEAFHYRNRIEVKWSLDQKGLVSVGYYAKMSHDLVAIDRCLIADERINDALRLVTSLQFPKRESVFQTSLEFQVIADGRVLVSGDDVPEGFWNDLRALTSTHPELIVNSTDFHVLEEWRGLRFHTRAGQFQQVNIPANRFLREWVLAFARQHHIRTTLDLYCGSGNLSLALAQDGIRVFGVEAFAPSIEAAQFNVKTNALSADYAAGDAGQIRELFPALPALDLLIVDPPRRGMAEAVDPVLKLGAALIIYVSCDPNTLARDLKQMLAEGYVLDRVMGLDFFPQSYHVETVCVLKKNP